MTYNMFSEAAFFGLCNMGVMSSAAVSEWEEVWNVLRRLSAPHRGLSSPAPCQPDDAHSESPGNTWFSTNAQAFASNCNSIQAFYFRILQNKSTNFWVTAEVPLHGQQEADELDFKFLNKSVQYVTSWMKHCETMQFPTNTFGQLDNVSFLLHMG